MKRISKIIIIVVFVTICIGLIPTKNTYAAWNDNAYDFYTVFRGKKEAKYNPQDKAWYFGQRGKTRTTNTYYGIIGFRIRVINGGKTYYCGVKVGSTMGTKPDVVTGGYTYSLWYVTFDRLMA